MASPLPDQLTLPLTLILTLTLTRLSVGSESTMSATTSISTVPTTIAKEELTAERERETPTKPSQQSLRDHLLWSAGRHCYPSQVLAVQSMCTTIHWSCRGRCRDPAVDQLRVSGGRYLPRRFCYCDKWCPFYKDCCWDSHSRCPLKHPVQLVGSAGGPGVEAPIAHVRDDGGETEGEAAVRRRRRQALEKFPPMTSVSTTTTSLVTDAGDLAANMGLGLVASNLNVHDPLNLEFTHVDKTSDESNGRGQNGEEHPNQSDDPEESEGGAVDQSDDEKDGGESPFTIPVWPKGMEFKTHSICRSGYSALAGCSRIVPKLQDPIVTDPVIGLTFLSQNHATCYHQQLGVPVSFRSLIPWDRVIHTRTQIHLSTFVDGLKNGGLPVSLLMSTVIEDVPPDRVKRFLRSCADRIKTSCHGKSCVPEDSMSPATHIKDTCVLFRKSFDPGNKPAPGLRADRDNPVVVAEGDDNNNNNNNNNHSLSETPATTRREASVSDEHSRSEKSSDWLKFSWRGLTGSKDSCDMTPVESDADVESATYPYAYNIQVRVGGSKISAAGSRLSNWEYITCSDVYLSSCRVDIKCRDNFELDESQSACVPIDSLEVTLTFATARLKTCNPMRYLEMVPKYILDGQVELNSVDITNNYLNETLVAVGNYSLYSSNTMMPIYLPQARGNISSFIRKLDSNALTGSQVCQVGQASSSLAEAREDGKGRNKICDSGRHLLNLLRFDPNQGLEAGRDRGDNSSLANQPIGIADLLPSQGHGAHEGEGHPEMVPQTEGEMTTSDSPRAEAFSTHDQQQKTTATGDRRTRRPVEYANRYDDTQNIADRPLSAGTDEEEGNEREEPDDVINTSTHHGTTEGPTNEHEEVESIDSIKDENSVRPTHTNKNDIPNGVQRDDSNSNTSIDTVSSIDTGENINLGPSVIIGDGNDDVSKSDEDGEINENGDDEDGDDADEDEDKNVEEDLSSAQVGNEKESESSSDRPGRGYGGLLVWFDILMVLVLTYYG